MDSSCLKSTSIPQYSETPDPNREKPRLEKLHVSMRPCLLRTAANDSEDALLLAADPAAASVVLCVRLREYVSN